MEYVLFIAILVTLVVLGVVITIGNEKQRRAIEEVRKQIEDWASEDIRIRREKIAREIKVDDPLQWVSRVASSTFGYSVKVEEMERYENGGVARALVCQAGNTRLVLTPVAPKEFVSLVAPKKSKDKLSGYHVSILGSKPAKVPVYELSVLNQGMFFDLEAQKVWEQSFGEPLKFSRLYMFKVG